MNNAAATQSIRFSSLASAPTNDATARPGQMANAAPVAPQAPAVDLYEAIQFLSLAKVLDIAANNPNATYGALL